MCRRGGQRRRGRERGRERQRLGIPSRFCTVSPKELLKAWTPQPWVHDLSWSQKLNRLSHPGAPDKSFIVNELQFFYLFFLLRFSFLNNLYTQRGTGTKDPEIESQAPPNEPARRPSFILNSYFPGRLPWGLKWFSVCKNVSFDKNFAQVMNNRFCSTIMKHKRGFVYVFISTAGNLTNTLVHLLGKSFWDCQLNKRFFNVYFLRESTSRGGAERERDTESEAGSKLSAQSPMQGLNSQTQNHSLSWSQTLNRLSHPGAPEIANFQGTPVSTSALIHSDTFFWSRCFWEVFCSGN